MLEKSFIRGEQYQGPQPLGNYLPSNRSGIVKIWLDNLPEKPRLVLFPFGTSPHIIVEAARSGYRALVPIHNPITRFVLMRLAQPSLIDNYPTALARLGASYKGRERLKPYILSLYETYCPGCGQRIPADSFIWSRSKRIPIKKTCQCSQCGDTSETELTEDDLEKALAYRENSPTHARALTRVAPPDDPIRIQVESALRSYPPRSLYALFTILNRLAGLNQSEVERSDLETLLLHGFYRCSGPDQNLDQDLYREENVWHVLEETPQIWNSTEKSLPVLSWPDLPPESGGISIFPGRARDFLDQLPGKEIDAVWMTFPKPVQSFWALSALWTGWLWGQEAAEPLHNILGPQDFNWNWLTRAIASTISWMREILPEGIPCFGLIPEMEIYSLLSCITAAVSGGLTLKSIALDPDLQQGQTNWLLNGISETPEATSEMIRKTIRTAGLDLLQNTGEPQTTLSLYAAGMAGLGSNNLLPDYIGNDLEEQYNQLEKDFEENIAYRQGFLHYPKSNVWWHQELGISPLPDSDQVEQILVSMLVDAELSLSEKIIYDHLYQEFPGLKTPRNGLIEVCLSSYGQPTQGKSGEWELKPNDFPDRRRQDLLDIKQIIRNLGEQLGYAITENPALGNVLDIGWYQGNSKQERFFISASANLNKIITQETNTPERKWIILPGSRAELIHYKMKNNPPLAATLEADWGLIKYRHIRRLSDEGGLTRENLSERLELDPFTSDSPQLQLI